MNKMAKLKRKILDIIFWIALIVGIIMVLWKIFGKSPSDLTIILPFIVMLISRVWNMNNEFIDFRYHVKISFKKVKGDLENMGKNINEIKTKINNLSNKKFVKK